MDERPIYSPVGRAMAWLRLRLMLLSSRVAAGSWAVMMRSSLAWPGSFVPALLTLPQFPRSGDVRFVGIEVTMKP
jgi:hypothetical protein